MQELTLERLEDLRKRIQLLKMATLLPDNRISNSDELASNFQKQLERYKKVFPEEFI